MKKEPFIKSTTSQKLTIDIRSVLQGDKPVPVTDDPQSPLNNGMNFHLVNDILAQLPIMFLEIHECRNMKSKIEEWRQTEGLDFLSSINE
jgi:hypothetical protein